MTDKKDKDYFDFLCDRLLELIALPVPKDKYGSVENLICRYTNELREKVIDNTNKEEIDAEFKHYVKNILSIIETLVSGDQYKAVRRLLQNEIYSCCNIITTQLDEKAAGRKKSG